MNPVERLLQFIDAAKANTDIKPVHISVYLSLYQCWILNECKNPIQICRRTIMQAAKISSYATYHKAINDLCAFKAISYIPSYDPRLGSQVNLLN